MAGKDKVSFVRSKDFESIDDELNAAMDQLEDTNERIAKLLETETLAPTGVTGELFEEAPDPETTEKAPD
jgi:hypothetical protein